jgi:NAD(P)-dependent dehydrogenase (short-subunit alcohol dehydrogenase family)
MEIKNTAAVITGGASGMGAATARLLSQAGAKVALLDLNLAQAEKIAAEVGGIAIACDVTSEDSVTAALSQASQQHGPARICVNCAGIVHSRRMINKEGPMSLTEYQRVMQINVVGTFNVMRLAAAAMIPLTPVGESSERGIIINTASIAAYEGQIGQTAYSASKGAIVGMTLPAARELAQFGIRVMTIAPGLVDTPMFEKLSPELHTSLTAMVPFPKRLAKPVEFAMLAQHIIENAMLNGEVIRLDGGLRMQAK